jgi:twinkle protein
VWELLQSTQSLIGIVALEEAPGETARKLSALPLNKNPAHKEIPQEELDVGFEQVFGSDRLLVLDHQGSMTDDSLPDLLEYMCLSGCKYIFIDHLTILISEGVEGLTGNEAQDKVMADLLRLVKKHDDVYIGLVSHLRKTTNTGKAFEEGRMPNLDDIRGSGSTKQISMDIIAFARDMTATDENVRNTINMSVLKCRYTGLTGPVPGAFYNYETGRLRALPPEGFEVL